MSEYQCLSLIFEDEIATLRLTRPELHNRFDEQLHREFPAALAEIRRKPDLAAVIIAAEGRSFSAGGDLQMMLRANSSAELRDILANEARAIIDGLLDVPVPIIAALQGSAIGLGATVIACCDIVVAWSGAKISDPHVVLGLAAGDGGVLGWTQSVGVMRAKRFLLTGESISAQHAYEFGLITDIVASPADVGPTAVTLARKIAQLPRGGVRGTKRAFSSLTRKLYMSAFEESLSLEMETLASEEVRQVVEAQLAR